MIDVIRGVFKQSYAKLSGRANRTEYWIWALFVVVVNIIVVALASLSTSLYYVAMGIVFVVTVIPGTCVAVRRLHDTGRGGGWIFINLVPAIGAIWFLVLMLLPSEPQPNRFGDVPTTQL